MCSIPSTANTSIELGVPSLTLAAYPPEEGPKVSRVPASISHTFRGHPANVSGVTLPLRGIGNGADIRIRLCTVCSGSGKLFCTYELRSLPLLLPRRRGSLLAPLS